MTAGFPLRLEAQVSAKGGPLVLGLDPRPERIPEALRRGTGAAGAVLAFHRRLLDLAAPLVACVKPQVAFFEALGHEGWRAYEETCRMARERGLLVVADAKRGDVAGTAEAYARAHLDLADAVTVQPWLGSDSLAPFLRRCREDGKGIFVLVRTSNPSAREFQGLRAEGRTLCEHVAAAVDRWGRETTPRGDFSAVGAVVGATWPQELAALRALMPRAWLLLPGVGPQGGRLEDLACAFDARGRGGLVAVSRAVLESFDPGDGAWEERVLQALRTLHGQAAALGAGAGPGEPAP